MAGIKREAGMPNELLSGKNARALCNALWKRLHDPGSSFGKQYLRLLVKDDRITGKEIRMRVTCPCPDHLVLTNSTS
jgi:hypothetical protein